MKNSPLTTILLAALAISALASVILCWGYISNARELRALRTQTEAINNRQLGMNSLAADLVEYSKKNAAIKPLLESVNIRTEPSGSSTNKPAPK